MEGILGWIIALVLVLFGAGGAGLAIGKKDEKKHTVVRDTDVMDGVIKLIQKQSGLKKSVAQVKVEADEETKKVSKKLKEASNDQIVSMFSDAFSSTPEHSHRARRARGRTPD